MDIYNRSAAIYDAIYSSKNYEAETETLKGLIAHYQTNTGKTLLDVACGTGRHLVYLRTDYALTGVDLSTDMLAAARAKLPDVPFHQGDMLTFDLGRQFDVVLCLFSSIGYMKTLETMRGAVANMARHVAPGGVLMVEPWLTPDDYQPGRFGARYVDLPSLKMARIHLSKVEGDVSVMDMHYLIATSNGVEYYVERHELGMYTQAQYMAAFQDAGLDAHHKMPGLDGRGLYVGVRP
jgi:ubiquinone/menaquinone biosynthesis C-methylase UbiE